VKHLLEGDANTKYYHLLANGRHRKTRIFQLEDGNSIITGDAHLKEHITSYYKNLFGPSEESLPLACLLVQRDAYQLSGHALRAINKRRAGATADRARWGADVAAAVGRGGAQ
jgi:hypothetical protein